MKWKKKERTHRAWNTEKEREKKSKSSPTFCEWPIISIYAANRRHCKFLCRQIISKHLVLFNIYTDIICSCIHEASRRSFVLSCKWNGLQFVWKKKKEKKKKLWCGLWQLLIHLTHNNTLLIIINSSKPLGISKMKRKGEILYQLIRLQLEK